MGKKMTNAMLEGGLTKMNTCTRLTVLSAEPNSIADITTTYKLASVTLDGSDYTLANGDVSGRKSTVAQQADILISTSGTPTHISLDDGTDYQVTTCSGDTLVANGMNTVTVPVFKREINNPT